MTIATNMAGRGTDIKLGGNADFLAKDDLRPQRDGGPPLSECDSYALTEDADILAAAKLIAAPWPSMSRWLPRRLRRSALPAACISLGTERHESRRIDNQLRGRSGRQGDPARPSSTSPWKTTSCVCSR